MEIRSSKQVIMNTTIFFAVFFLYGCTTQPSSINNTVTNKTAVLIRRQPPSTDNKVGIKTANEVQKVQVNPSLQTTLKLPNATIIAPNQTVQWKDLSIRLLVTSLPPSYVTTERYASVVGNHSTTVSHNTITTSAGKATLVLNKRTQPAASKSTAVTYEYWVIVYGSQYAYAIDATVIGNLNKARNEVIQLSQQWKVPH
ncbi:hypothetical protein LLE49_07690 [Alicyclobacillus tolerans]|uniref:hypothetical protein n=1 Tax=Alicyclobacillus tolerans TaxID=90970 RepID=UPI001F33746F|nr:hypothetical protein [Alicyclobacillus tolerans]MCF8564626.1 hypothetical protein [Alicyclobacillus tolerans]